MNCDTANRSEQKQNNWWTMQRLHLCLLIINKKQNLYALLCDFFQWNIVILVLTIICSKYSWWTYLAWKFSWIWKIEKETSVVNFAIDKCKLGMMDRGLCLNKEENRHCFKQVKLFSAFVHVKFGKIWKLWLNKYRSSILKENKEFKAMFTILFTYKIYMDLFQGCNGYICLHYLLFYSDFTLCSHSEVVIHQRTQSLQIELFLSNTVSASYKR